MINPRRLKHPTTGFIGAMFLLCLWFPSHGWNSNDTAFYAGVPYSLLGMTQNLEKSQGDRDLPWLDFIAYGCYISPRFEVVNSAWLEVVWILALLRELGGKVVIHEPVAPNVLWHGAWYSYLKCNWRLNCVARYRCIIQCRCTCNSIDASSHTCTWTS